MAIKAGQILHVANQFVVDRIQTAGPGDLNIPQEKVYELGNYQSVGIVRDVPDLSFNLECLDVDTEVEALLCGSTNPFEDPQGTKYELVKSKPLDITSPWKTPYGDFTAVHGVAMPALALESASYRYGLTENAGETFTLNGDSIYYCPGQPRQQVEVGDGTTVEYDFDQKALLYKEGGRSIFALAVSVDGERLTQVERSKLGQATAAGDTLVYAPGTAADEGIEFAVAPGAGKKISIVYATKIVTGQTFPQDGPSPYGTGTGNLVHQTVAVKPAAIRGKDMDVYFATALPVGGGVSNKALASNVATLTTASAHGLSVGDVISVEGVDSTFDGSYTVKAVPTTTTFTYDKVAANVASQADSGRVGTPVEVRWPDVQSVGLEWRQTLEEDYEFGNAKAVSRDATDVPTVTGNIELKPRSVEAFFNRMRQLTGTPLEEIVGPNSSVAGALRIELRNPESGGASAVPAGTVLKTHYVPDARFTIPGYSGQVQQKLSVTVNFESDGGILETFKGARV